MEKWKKSEFQNTCVKIEHVTKKVRGRSGIKRSKSYLKGGTGLRRCRK